jgi:predicted ribosomally synthesized peptide with nif11-like leader
MSSPIDDLIAELGSNSELRKAITTATSVEAATIIANNYGFKIDAKDLLDAYRIRLMELSDDELEGISGGTNKWQLINHSKNEICKHL